MDWPVIIATAATFLAIEAFLTLPGFFIFGVRNVWRWMLWVHGLLAVGALATALVVVVFVLPLAAIWGWAS